MNKRIDENEEEKNKHVSGRPGMSETTTRMGKTRRVTLSQQRGGQTKLGQNAEKSEVVGGGAARRSHCHFHTNDHSTLFLFM